MTASPTSTIVHKAPPHRASPLAVFLANRVLRFTRQPWYSRYKARRRDEAVAAGAVRFSVTAEDGVMLDALYLPANPGLKGPAWEARVPIVQLHGYTETKESHLGRARRMAQHGHPVVIYDLRAHGCSGGRCTTFGAKDRHDLRLVIDEAQRRGWVDERVITTGISLGASTALQHAAIDPRVAGVVAMAPFLDMKTAVNSYRALYGPVLPSAWLWRGFEHAAWREGFRADDASTLDAVGRVKAPVLLVVGSRDRNLSKAVHTDVLAKAKTEGSCEFMEVPGADHFNLCRICGPGVEEPIVRFCAAVQ